MRHIREFSLKPREIRDYLDRFVIQQHEAKKILSAAICDHCNHVRPCLDDLKQKIILLCPTNS